MTDLNTPRAEPSAAALKLAGPHRNSCPAMCNRGWKCQCPRKKRALAIDAHAASEVEREIAADRERIRCALFSQADSDWYSEGEWTLKQLKDIYREIVTPAPGEAKEVK